MKILRTKVLSDPEKKEKGKKNNDLLDSVDIAAAGIGGSQLATRISDSRDKKKFKNKEEEIKGEFDKYVKEELIPSRRKMINLEKEKLPDELSNILKAAKIKTSDGVDSDKIKRIKEEALNKYNKGKKRVKSQIDKEGVKLEKRLEASKIARRRIGIGSAVVGAGVYGTKKLIKSKDKNKQPRESDYDKDSKKEKVLRGISYGTKVGAIGSAVIPVRNIIKSEKDILKERYPNINNEDLMEKWTSEEFKNYRDKMSEKAQKINRKAMKYYEKELPKSEIKYLKHLKNGPKIATAAIPLAATSIGTKVAYKRLASKRKKREKEALKKVMEEQNKNN